MEKEYLNSLEQGIHVLLRENAKQIELLHNVQAIHENSVCDWTWKVSWPLRYLNSLWKKYLCGPRWVTEPLCLSQLKASEPRPLKNKLSVIIPTRNGYKDLAVLLETLHQQKGLGEVEYVVVDTQSTDGTCELARSYGALVIPIEQSAFSHSAARNIGAKAATGELLLFTTQDASFPDPEALFSMACILLQNKADAVSCVQTPRDDADLFAAYDIWKNILPHKDAAFDRAERLRRRPKNSSEWLQVIHIDDVAHMTKREIWQQHPFYGEFAEDLKYGAELLLAGKMTAQLCSVQVRHSHTRCAAAHFWRTVQAQLEIYSMWGGKRAATSYEAMAAYLKSNILALARLYEVEHPFLEKEECVYTVIERMKKNVGKGEGITDIQNLPFLAAEDIQLFKMISALQGERSEEDSMLGSLHEVMLYYMDVGKIAINPKEKIELFSMLAKLFFANAGWLCASAYLTNKAIPERFRKNFEKMGFCEKKAK